METNQDLDPASVQAVHRLLTSMGMGETAQCFLAESSRRSSPSATGSADGRSPDKVAGDESPVAEAPNSDASLRQRLSITKETIQELINFKLADIAEEGAAAAKVLSAFQAIIDRSSLAAVSPVSDGDSGNGLVTLDWSEERIQSVTRTIAPSTRAEVQHPGARHRCRQSIDHQDASRPCRGGDKEVYRAWNAIGTCSANIHPTPRYCCCRAHSTSLGDCLSMLALIPTKTLMS